VKLKKLDLPEVDFDQARHLARSATEAVREGKLGYTLVVGIKGRRRFMSRSAEAQIRARRRSNNPVQHNRVQENYTDWLIGLREKLLDKLGATQAGDVLNVSLAGPVPEPGVDPAADLKRALDSIKIAAVDDSGTHVDYASLRESAAYQEFRSVCSPRLRNFDPAELASREERLAFWINLYNVLVMDAVIALGIQRSVVEGKLGLLSFFRRAAYNVGGHRISLDEIEHGILRENRGNPIIPGRQFASQDPRLGWVIWPSEPRTHFALNCASKSCPPIQVYSAENIESQLKMAARSFVDANVKLDSSKDLFVISSIFRWFKEDFGGQAGVISFLIDHLPDDRRRAWLSKNQDVTQLRYAPYDWRLNTTE